MRKTLHQVTAMLAVAGTIAFLAGCGGGGGGSSGTTSSSSSSSSGSNNNPSGDLAMSSVAGKTLHGHIGGTNTVFELRFTGSGTSGGYTHFENGVQLESGTYTYTKTGSNTSAVNTMPNGGGVAATLNLTWNTASSGTYQIVQFPESGTFNF